MSSLSITLLLVCLVLLLVIILLGWYSVTLLRKLWALSANIDDAQYVVSEFRKHLEDVYKLETFYGDETLRNLLGHAESLSAVLEPYENMYDFVERIEIPELEEEEDAE